MLDVKSTSINCKAREGMKTKMLVFKNGERFPVLLGNDGIPLFYPTVYETAMRRQVNVASATLSADLIAIKFLYSWATQINIDIEKRFHQGEFLTVSEIENLTKAFKYRSDRYFEDANIFSVDQKLSNKPLKIRSLEAFRKTANRKPLNGVVSETTARRLYVVCSYLDWLAQVRTGWVSMSSKEYEALQTARGVMKESIQARIPDVKRDETNRREGLNKKDQDLLLDVIKPTSPRNPWRDVFTRHRNQLFICLLIELGPRRGEILLVRIGRDFNASANKLAITRVPDDKDDPRRDEPNAKTLEREYPLSEDLAKMLNKYITEVRNTVEGARRHDYLFVAARTGRPMSKAAVTKMFRELREKVTELPRDLTSHVLRHTWNDNFSEECDESGIDEETEMKTRCYLNGWKDGSKSAAVYTRRFIKRKGQEVSLKMQEKIAKGKKVKDDSHLDDIPW